MEELQERLARALPERYAVKAELGRGGMSVVFLAWDRKHDCDVALKVLRPELSATLGPARFLQEIKTAARLKHPYILKLHDSGEAGGLLFYVMPYVEAESLRQRLIRERQLPVADALRIAREVAEALDYAHSQRVVHRDIKPENILFEGGHAVVSDFGIALAVSAADSRDTGSGIILGTVEYMSPEQAQGERELDARSDIYSLGLVVYEMLIGEVPRLEVEGTVKTLERLRPGLPAGLGNVLKRALASNPDARFSTAREFADELARVGPRRFYERPRVQMIAAGATLAAVGIWWIAVPHGPALDDNKVVVFPLAERGRGGAGDQVALMIGNALEHTEPLEWIDGWRLLGPEERGDVARLTPQSGQRIARDRGARFFLQGSILEQGDSASVILWLTDAKSGTDVARASAAGSTRRRSLPQLGLEAVTEILPRLLPPGGRVDLAMLAGRKPAGVASWLQGEREYRRFNFVEALPYFRRAVGEDSLLAAAALRGAQAASWENAHDEADGLVGVALRHAALLSPRQANFARGLAAYLSGQADSAVHWLRLALRDSPEWIEAHMILGETYYHELPNADGSLDSLAEVEFLAAAVDTGFSLPQLHLAELAIRSGDFARAAAAIADYARAAPGAADTHMELALMLECAARGPGSVEWSVEARQAPFRTLKVAKSLAAAATFPGCAEEGFRAVLGDTAIAMNYRWGALVGLQSVFAAQNRLRELRAVLDSAIASGVEFANRFYLLDALAGLDVEDRVIALAADYERGAPGRSMTPSVVWMLGTWYAQGGATAKAESLQRVLARAAHEGDPDAIRYAEALSARMALQRGDTTAVARLRALFARGNRDALDWALGEPLAADRLLVAEFLLARGRAAEALAVAETLDHPTPMTFLPFLPASLALRREAARALGRTDVSRHFEKRLSALGREELTARRSTPTGRSR